MAAVADARGLKRICTGCGAHFYDLNKRPITCPTCDTEFTGEVKVKSRRGRTAAAVEDQVAAKNKAIAANDEKDHDDVTDDLDVVSLEDAEEADLDDEDEIADADLDLDSIEEDLDDDLDDDLSDLEGDVDLKVESEKE